MTIRSAPILSLCRAVLYAMLGATLIVAAISLMVLGSSFFGEEGLILSADRGTVALRCVMAIVLVGCGLAWFIFAQLLAMVKTVIAGEPFVARNARRLTMMAWTMLALQCLVVGMQPLSDILFGSDDKFEWSFSITGWLAVLLLFVLGRVFEEGARMREDLEGTV